MDTFVAMLEAAGLTPDQVRRAALFRVVSQDERLMTQVAGIMIKGGMIAPGEKPRAATALIEFVRIRDYDFHAKTPTHKRWRDEKYYAFILHSQDPKSLDFVFIGDAGPIDEMIFSLKNAIVSDRQNWNINHISTVSGKAYKHLFLPLRNKLPAVSTFFLSPDSYLNLFTRSKYFYSQQGDF